jgi:hypothetical protein
MHCQVCALLLTFGDVAIGGRHCDRPGDCLDVTTAGNKKGASPMMDPRREHLRWLRFEVPRELFKLKRDAEC